MPTDEKLNFPKAPVAIIVIACFFIVIFTSAWFYEKSYSGKVYPGVMVGSFSMSGLDTEESEKTIKSQIDSLRQSGLVFVFRDRKVSIPMSVVSTGDPDLSHDVIKYDIPKTLYLAFSYGRQGQGLYQWYERLRGVFIRKRIDPVFEWDKESTLGILKENLSMFEHPAQDARLLIQNGVASITQDESGIIFDYEDALDEARNQLREMVFFNIELKIKKDEPEVKYSEAIGLIDEAQKIIYKEGVNIKYGEMQWYLPASTINDWIEIKKDSQTGKIVLGISEEKFGIFLDPIKSSINIESREPRFFIEDGKVKEFQAGSVGKKINEPKTLKQWEQILLNSEFPIKEIELVVEDIYPTQKIEDLNDLGIKELLGVGFTSFAGSPRNRRHNISNGSNTLNGIIIEPGEEFSLVKALGNIDAASGYLTELVIKGNQTVPEYGGGLCQIGTTVFRAALASGLPITERRPHSYTVSYYFDEKGKPGKDATIYIPHPDLKFINDTGNNILIFSRIEENDLFFEFWGAKDGRLAEQSDVTVWDRVSPPETKYVETLSLKVGEKKCTEHPHAGMKASFDYTVTYPSGEKKEQNFFSQYLPWQEVCLIGVEKLSSEVDEDSLSEENITNQDISAPAEPNPDNLQN